MKLRYPFSSTSQRGHALVIVLVFLVVGLVILGGTMSRMAANARLIDRNQEYFRTVEAAEAATEKVISAMSTDYQKCGPAELLRRLDTYPTRVPNAEEHPEWEGTPSPPRTVRQTALWWCK